MNNPHDPHERFSELEPPMSRREATLEANRCLYCFDAPCIKACPTHIDVPTFIRKIATGNVTGAAVTIFEANLMAASCSRVCPVEELCEGACVLSSDHKPIEIGRLQRYAMDHVYSTMHSKGTIPFTPAPANGRRVAVVGAGPAGLSCAGELAKLGYAVTVFEKRELPGGLSTYGIVVLREPIRVALEEVAFIEALGVNVKTGLEVGQDIPPETLLRDYDMVFIGTGMGGVPDLNIPGEDLEGVFEALGFIEATKLAEKEGIETLGDIFVGHRVAVIGAGNTAIDAATIAKRLGAQVTIVYRRSATEMPAYDFEVRFARQEGIEFRFLSQPTEIVGAEGRVTGLRCHRVHLGEADSSGRRTPQMVSGSGFMLDCDQVIRAIGQEKPHVLMGAFGLESEHGFIRVDATLRTSHPKVYAGGDCIRSRGAAMTVTATEDGKRAAASIHAALNSTLSADEPQELTWPT